MNIRTKALLKTLTFLGGSFAVGGLFVLLSILISQKVAAITFAVGVIGYLSWIMYDHYVRAYEFEERYGK